MHMHRAIGEGVNKSKKVSASQWVREFPKEWLTAILLCTTCHGELSLGEEHASQPHCLNQTHPAIQLIIVLYWNNRLVLKE